MKLKTVIQVLLVIFAGQIANIPQPAISRDFEINSDLSKLELSFDVAYEQINKPVTQLNSSYATALERLFKSESGAGRLDSSVEIKKEKTYFGDGSDFDIGVFSKRSTENQALEKVRQKYLSERFRLRKLNQSPRSKLAENYRIVLKDYELKQTKLGEVEVALIARKMREELDKDPRFSGEAEIPSNARTYNGIIYFVGKGEIELHLNGARVSYLNRADRDTQYVDGKSRPQKIRVGDILRVRMRGTSVYRSLILAIECKDDNLSVPITVKDFRFGGTSIRSEDLKLEKVIQISDRPDAGRPDVNMDEMWKKKLLSEASRTNSEWIKISSSPSWHTYFIVIKKDMLLPSE